MHSLRVERCAFSALVLLIEKIVREGEKKFHGLAFVLLCNSKKNAQTFPINFLVISQTVDKGENVETGKCTGSPFLPLHGRILTLLNGPTSSLSTRM